MPDYRTVTDVKQNPAQRRIAGAWDLTDSAGIPDLDTRRVLRQSKAPMSLFPSPRPLSGISMTRSTSMPPSSGHLRALQHARRCSVEFEARVLLNYALDLLEAETPSSPLSAVPDPPDVPRPASRMALRHSRYDAARPRSQAAVWVNEQGSPRQVEQLPTHDRTPSTRTVSTVSMDAVDIPPPGSHSISHRQRGSSLTASSIANGRYSTVSRWPFYKPADLALVNVTHDTENPVMVVRAQSHAWQASSDDLPTSQAFDALPHPWSETAGNYAFQPDLNHQSSPADRESLPPAPPSSPTSAEFHYSPSIDLHPARNLSRAHPPPVQPIGSAPTAPSSPSDGQLTTLEEASSPMTANQDNVGQDTERETIGSRQTSSTRGSPKAHCFKQHVTGPSKPRKPRKERWSSLFKNWMIEWRLANRRPSRLKRGSDMTIQPLDSGDTIPSTTMAPPASQALGTVEQSPPGFYKARIQRRSAAPPALNVPPFCNGALTQLHSPDFLPPDKYPFNVSPDRRRRISRPPVTRHQSASHSRHNHSLCSFITFPDSETFDLTQY